MESWADKTARLSKLAEETRRNLNALCAKAVERMKRPVTIPPSQETVLKHRDAAHHCLINLLTAEMVCRWEKDPEARLRIVDDLMDKVSRVLVEASDARAAEGEEIGRMVAVIGTGIKTTITNSHFE